MVDLAMTPTLAAALLVAALWLWAMLSGRRHLVRGLGWWTVALALLLLALGAVGIVEQRYVE